MPPVVTTSSAEKPMGASLNVKVIVAVSFVFTAGTLLVISRVGARVSMLILDIVCALPAFSAISV